jgi:hypothetical protein
MDQLPRSLPTAALLAAAALATACGVPVRAPVEVDWTFAGKGCADAGVATIRFAVAGEVVSPDTYTCAEANKGVNIGSYLLGFYQITVQGLDSLGTLAFEKTANVEVRNTNNLFLIDADAVASNPNGDGTLTLLWQFNGQTCAQSGVTTVHVKLDGQAVTDGANNPDLPCSASGTDGTSISSVSPGSHTIDLVGLKGSQLAYSLMGVSAAVQANADTRLTPNLLPSSSSGTSAYIHWTFAQLSCADAKVDSVRVFVDGQQQSPDYPCSASGADAGTVPIASSGNHTLTLQAIRTAGNALVYATTQGTTAAFSTGLTTQVLIDAPASSPGVGGIKLTWSGGVCDGASPASLNYTLHAPDGHSTISGSVSCSSAPAQHSFTICNPAGASCPAGSAGLAAGNWTIDASATSGGTTSTATAAPFAVPNAETGAATIVFH